MTLRLRLDVLSLQNLQFGGKIFQPLTLFWAQKTLQAKTLKNVFGSNFAHNNIKLIEQNVSHWCPWQ